MHHISAKFMLHLLTDDQKENHVEISQELLANANGNENFLKNIIDVGLWVWCWNQDADVAVDRKRVSLTKKSTDESVEDQGGVGCVLWLERHCPSWICTMWSDGKQTVVPGSFSVFQGCCAQEEAWIVGKPGLDVAPQQCAAHRLLLNHSYLAKHQTSVVLHPTLFSRLSLSRHFPVSQT